MKAISVAIVVLIIAAFAYYGIARYQRSRRNIGNSVHFVQGIDPCSGTGGNGKIVSIGDNGFVMSVIHGKNNGSNQAVHLSDKTVIRTSTGAASLSALQVGGRITVAGSSNPDDSFTAKLVAVCE